MYILYTFLYYTVQFVHCQVFVYNLYYNFFMNERLKQIRIERGIPIREVATALDMTVSAYAHYEQGRREPSIEILIRICKFFDVSADYLLGLTEY